MPELPEVETIRRQLSDYLPGEKLTSYKILDPKFKRYLNQKKLDECKGKKITAVNRIAKVLLLGFENDLFLAFHLKMTGQIIIKNVKRKGKNILSKQAKYPNKHTRVVLKFSEGFVIYFQDMRRFGWLKVLTKKELKTNLLKEKLGPEPLSRQYTFLYFREQTKKSAQPIKLMLLDQKKIAGIGNIYANEGLYLAGVRPQKKANQLTLKESRAVYKTSKSVLKKGIKYGGASDNMYLNAFGEKGEYQKHFLVYRRDGKKCLKCHNTIKRIRLGGRGTFYCPNCQK